MTEATAVGEIVDRLERAMGDIHNSQRWADEPAPGEYSGLSYMEWINEALDVAHADILALRARADLPPKVKKLVWEGFRPDLPSREMAATPMGKVYHVDETGWWFPLSTLHKCDGKEAAKAAAQADYERRILAALDLGGEE